MAQKSMKDYMYARASMSTKGGEPKPAKNQGYVEHKNKVMEENPRAIGGLTGDEVRDYDKNIYKPKQKEWQKMVNKGQITKGMMKDSVNYYKPDKVDAKKLPAPSKPSKKKKIGIGWGNDPFW